MLRAATARKCARSANVSCWPPRDGRRAHGRARSLHGSRMALLAQLGLRDLAKLVVDERNQRSSAPLSPPDHSRSRAVTAFAPPVSDPIRCISLARK